LDFGWLTQRAFAGDLSFGTRSALWRIFWLFKVVLGHLIEQRGAISFSLVLADALAATSLTLLHSVRYRALKWVGRAIFIGGFDSLDERARAVLEESFCEVTIEAKGIQMSLASLAIRFLTQSEWVRLP